MEKEQIKVVGKVDLGLNRIKSDVNIKTIGSEEKTVRIEEGHLFKLTFNRFDKFNPDTYILQKLMLIEIREALLGVIVE